MTCSSVFEHLARTVLNICGHARQVQEIAMSLVYCHFETFKGSQCKLWSQLRAVMSVVAPQGTSFQRVEMFKTRILNISLLSQGESPRYLVFT